ncbi:restriction endonuclease, partial [Chloroflexota bacterium]
MMMYRRTYEELEKKASKFWPSEFSELESQISIIPKLLNTQDKFISIIGSGPLDINKLFEIIKNTDLPANLFLKHLVILADFGGEMLKRVSNEVDLLFPDKELAYYWRGKD